MQPDRPKLFIMDFNQQNISTINLHSNKSIFVFHSLISMKFYLTGS